MLKQMSTSALLEKNGGSDPRNNAPCTCGCGGRKVRVYQYTWLGRCYGYAHVGYAETCKDSCITYYIGETPYYIAKFWN